MGFKAFLKALDPSLMDDYRRAYWQETRGGRTSKPSALPPKPIYQPPPAPTSAVISVDSDHFVNLLTLPPDHPAVRYAERRHIPRNWWQNFGFTTQFGSLIGDLGWDAPKSLQNAPRDALVILATDTTGRILAAQARLLAVSGGLRYLTAVAPDAQPVFGIRADVLKEENQDQIFIVEGPIDSVCLQFGMAAMNSGLDSAAQKVSQAYGVNTDRWIRCTDFEPRNTQIMNRLRQSIDAGYSVVIPDMSRLRGCKDVNEFVCLTGTEPSEMSRLLRTMVYRGLRARMKHLELLRRD